MISSIYAPSPGKNAVSGRADNKRWETATWKGSRSAQLRAALAMTIRERFQALEALTELAQRLAAMPRVSKAVTKRSRIAG
jgi:hypothetical protein